LSVLNSNSKTYRLDWIGKLFLNNEGMDVFEDEKKIGTIKGLTFFDDNNSVVLSMTTRKKGLSDSLNLEDENGTRLGVASRESPALLKDPQGKEILYSVRTSHKGQNSNKFYKRILSYIEHAGNFVIKNHEKEEIAKFSYSYKKIQPQEKVFLNKLRGTDRNTATLEITKIDYDRRILLGFFILSLYYLIESEYTGGGP